MYKKRAPEAGFTAIEVILIAVLIGSIGTAIFFAVKAGSTKPTAATNNTSLQTVPTPVAPTKNSLGYTDQSKTFSINYPSTWSLLDTPTDLGTYTLPLLSDSKPLRFRPINSTSPQGTFVAYLTAFKVGANPGQLVAANEPLYEPTQTDSKINGYEAHYFVTESASAIQYTYYLIHNNVALNFTMYAYGGKPEYASQSVDFEALVRSTKFLK